MLAEQIGNMGNSPRVRCLMVDVYIHHFLQAIISMLIPMAYHNGLRQTLARLLKTRRATVEPGGAIHSLSGERMNFSPEQARDLYFAVSQLKLLNMHNSPCRLTETRGIERIVLAREIALVLIIIDVLSAVVKL